MSWRLLERVQAVAAIERALQRACAGEGSAVFLVGEGGLGKTALLDWARSETPAVMDVAFGRGEPMEAELAFGLGGQALDGAGIDLIDLARSAIEPSVPYYRTLRQLAARADRPLLLALDDLHWSDGDSLSLFGFLARRVSTLGVALIGTLRQWPPRALELCQALAYDGNATLVYLRPLGRESVQTLLADRCGAPVPDAAVDRALDLAGGNPLLTEQLAQALARGDRLPAGGGALGVGHGIVLARFAGLDSAGLEVARAASVFGASFRPELVLDAAEVERGRGTRALDAICASGLAFEEDTGVLRFTHPLFAQALYEDLPATTRLRLHGRAYASLAARGLEAQAAEHAIRADLAGDRDAIELLLRVGLDALAAGAVQAATWNLDAAVRLGGDRVAAPVLLASAQALAANGRMEEVASVCRRLLSLDSLDWRQRIEILRLLGRALYLTGAPDRGGAALERAVSIALEQDPSSAVEPLLDQSLSTWLAAGPAGALPLAARARDLADRADPALREHVEATWGHMALESGDREGLAATEPLARYLEPGALAGAFSPGELIWPWAGIYQFGLNANYAGRHADAERAFKLARNVVEETGAANALATLAIYISHAVIRQGRLEDALAEAVRAEEFCELTPGVLVYAQLARAEALAWLGRLPESELLCAEAEANVEGQWFARLWLAHVRGLRCLTEADPRASDELLVAERLTRWAGINEPCHFLWAGHAVSAHLAAGREADARRVVDWVEQCAARLPCVWPQIAAAIGRAELAERAGDDAQAEQEYARGLALHARVDMPLQRTEALLALGGFLRRRGRRADARPHLAAALDLADGVGASRLAARSREELSLAGGRRRRSPERRDELTEAEARVAELAAAGHSNAEIAGRLYLSVNTVQTHLKHAFAKLEINSRHRLRDRLPSSRR